MKSIKITLTLLALVALTLALAGCPKSGKMMKKGDTTNPSTVEMIG